MKKTMKITMLLLVAVFLFVGIFHSNSFTSQAAGKTTTKVSTKKTTKITKLKKKSKKKTRKKTSKKIITKRFKESCYQVVQKTTITTTIVTKYKSKKKIVTTTVKTRVETTKTRLVSQEKEEIWKKVSGQLYESTAHMNGGDISIQSLSGLVHPMVIAAFEELDYKIFVKSNVPYAGMFDARNQQIILRSANVDYLLHELGHFVSFITGIKDSTEEFQNIYSREVSAYVGSNQAYVTKDAKEYFAESFRDFYISPSTMKRVRPATYNYIKSCIESIAEDTIEYINTAYYAA